MVIVPDVTGMTLAKAKQALGQYGLKAQTDGDQGQVKAQMPAPGATLAAGGQVMLYTYETEPISVDTLVTVPDVKGLSIVEASRTLRLRGLQMTIEGSGVAVSQSPMAGDVVKKDATVVVTFSLPN